MAVTLTWGEDVPGVEPSPLAWEVRKGVMFSCPHPSRAVTQSGVAGATAVDCSADATDLRSLLTLSRSPWINTSPFMCALGAVSRNVKYVL